MRVTSTSVHSSLASQINAQYANYAKLTQQIGTGNRVNSMMDDPIESVNIVNSSRHLNRIGTWSANIDSLNNEIKQSSETIDLMMKKAQRAKDLAATAANGASGLDSLKATMTELNQIIRGFVDMANTNYNGNYIYGGANTKNPPYEIVYGIDDTGAQTDEIVGIKYNGTPLNEDWERQLEIAGGLFERMNITGIEAFGDYNKQPVYDTDEVTPILDADGNPTYNIESESGIFSDLMRFKEKLQETIDKMTERDQLPQNTSQAYRNSLGADIKACYDDLSNLLDKFTSSIDKMVVINSDFGTITNKLEMSKESLKDNELNLKEYISGIRDLDITQALSDWYSSQYAYQASMQASTSIMSMSLLNYI